MTDEEDKELTEKILEIMKRHAGTIQMLAKNDGSEHYSPTRISEWDVLAIVNGWLDDERFAYDLTDDEQKACDVVLGINIRRQREWKERSERKQEYVEGESCPRCGCEYLRLQPLVLASMPPIPSVQCPECGWNSYYDGKKKGE